LPIVLIGVLMAFGALCGSADAAVVWSEDFDGVASGTVLTSANMPGWTFQGVLGGSTAIATTTNSAASNPNAISHLANGAARGAMFHDAGGAIELQFSFLRRQQTNPVSYQNTTVEIALTTTDAIAGSNGLSGPRVEMVVDSRDATANPEFGFYVRDASNGVLSRWQLDNTLIDDGWYDGLIRLESDNTATFAYRAVGVTNFITSTGHALAAGFSPNYVGASLFAHRYTNGRTYLDNIVADDGANVVPEPSSVVTWIAFSLCGLAFTWRRRRQAA
jgi:hypothetical protein